MRIERSGRIEALTPRVERFIAEALGGVSLDKLQAHHTRRADYLCLRGLLAIELKSLEDNGDTRMNNLQGELSRRPDWPMFLGSAPMSSFIANTDDPEGISRAVLERVSRGVLGPLKKAERQLAAHRTNFARANQVCILVLVNEDHEIYDPHTVSYILWHAVRRMDAGAFRYRNIDAVIYFTERHATMLGGKVVFPCVSVESPAIGGEEWKGDVIDLVTRRWTDWNFGDRLDDNLDISAFSTIEQVPEMMKRHELWRLEYRRNPHMRAMSKVALHERFDEVMLMSTLSFIRGSPLELSRESVTIVMEQMTHLMVEMGERAIPVTEFGSDPGRTLAAARRMGLKPNVIEWLIQFEEQRADERTRKR